MNDQQRAAMQMALEALEVLLTCKHGEFCDHYQDAERQSKKTIIALREALNTRSSPTHSDAEYSEVVQPQDNLNCKSVQARLATSWGYVKAQPQGDDDLTIAYMVGYEKGKDETKEKAAKLLEAGVLGHGECAAAIRSMK